MSGFHRKSKRQKALKERALEIEAHWARGTNSKGLPVLADELLLEILSYFPPIPLPTVTQNTVDTSAHVSRCEALRALSTASSNLRRFFRPYVWERIAVCAGCPAGESVLAYGLGKQGDKEFAMELIKQLEIVTIRDPSLADQVR